MDELIVLLIRWVVRMMNNRANPPGTTGRGTPALPPAWSGGGSSAGAPPLPGVPRTVVRRQLPALRQVKLARPLNAQQPVAAAKPVAGLPRKPAAVAVTHTGLTSLQSSFTPESIRKQWVLYELLQPPVALRESTEHPSRARNQ